MLTVIALLIVGATVALGVYAYLGYPLLLALAGHHRDAAFPTDDPAEWPMVSISVPVYNEEAQVRGLVESLLALDYPRHRLQILVVSDASNDRTDEIVREYADRGVELLRTPERGGKTRAENAAAQHLRGDIVVNTDASIRIPPPSLKCLVRAFQDPGIGSASGRDVSVAPGREAGNLSESGYVGYEMAVRDLETKVGGIIGASGCFYAIRPELHRLPLPDMLSRDFASALHTHEKGFRAVSVPDALCYVPRTDSLAREYRRKVRTITRGMETLIHKRSLLNPIRHGGFAFKLFSHKVCRWLLPWAATASWLALGWLAFESRWALFLFVAGAAALVWAALGWVIATKGDHRSILTLPAFVVAGNVAAMHALFRVIRGDEDPTWEPTRR